MVNRGGGGLLGGGGGGGDGGDNPPRRRGPPKDRRPDFDPTQDFEPDDEGDDYDPATPLRFFISTRTGGPCENTVHIRQEGPCMVDLLQRRSHGRSPAQEIPDLLHRGPSETLP